MPEGSGAPPAAAAAPVAAAPAPVASPAPVAPAPVETPAVAPVSAEPAVPAAEPVAAAPAAASGPAEPKQEDFPGDVVGFLEAHNKWEWDQNGEAKPAEAAPEAAPVAEVPKPDAEAKPAEPDQSLTPESLNALALKSPELKAALDASPEVKQALFAMARVNAKAAPILEVFPNVESAKFAAEASNTMVTLRTSFMESVDNPESFPEAFAQFADEFRQKDKDGNPAVDAQGNPVYDEDFQMLNDYVVDTYHAIEIDDLKGQIEANQFATQDQRDTAEQVLAALEYVRDWKAGKIGGLEKPNLEGLSPEAKAYYERKEAELAERENALKGNEKTQTVEQRKAERQTYETNVAKKIGGSVGSRLKALVTEDEKAGVFLPSYVTTAKDPKTGISIFAKTLLDQFEEATYGRVDEATGKIIGGVSYIRDQAKMLQRRPPSADAEKARVDFVNGLIDQFLPEIYAKEKRAVQNKDIQDRERRTGNAEVRTQMADREPSGGSAPQPRALDAATAMQQAYQWVDQNFPDAGPAERTEKALIKKNELVGARY